MIKVIKNTPEDIQKITHQEPAQDHAKIMAILSDIKTNVTKNGDTAVLDYTKMFDKLTNTSFNMQVTESEIKEAYKVVSADFIKALKKAKENLIRFHKYQRPKSWLKRKKNGISYGMTYNPIDSVGLYVPGGRANYPSSVLMNAVPGLIANVPNLIMVSPPKQDGTLSPEVLVAADLCKISKIFKVGGAQAIFALAQGTQIIPKVDKIVGPGNIYVTLAKQLVYGQVDIDKPAGPSEVLVYIDDKKYARFAASELLAQLEHDPNAIALCIAENITVLDAIKTELTTQLDACSRKEIIKKALTNSALILTENRQASISLMNDIASEHLVLLVDNYQSLMKKVKHAGNIFCGPYTPVALGDYFAGPNHVLPTGGTARFSSPLNVMDYVKFSSRLTYSKRQLEIASKYIKPLAEAEGFDAHYKSVEERLK
jgi:histidinol dehydrogenase